MPAGVRGGQELLRGCEFGGELRVSGTTTVVYDTNTKVSPDKLPLAGVTPAEVFPVPIEQMARDTGGSDRANHSI